MKPTSIKKVIETMFVNKMKVKPFITGSPGCGKTSIMYQLFREQGVTLNGKKQTIPVYVFQAMLYDPVEIKGLPVWMAKEGVAKFIKFEDMPSGENGEEGILFVDDFPHAPAQTQNAFMRLFLEGQAGAWSLGNLYPIAAGNRAMDRAGAKDIQTAMANRFEFIEFDIDYEDWREHAISKSFAPQVIGYLGSPHGREWLDHFRAEDKINPTPRSWEYASCFMKAMPNSDLLRESLHGCIGQEATAKFMQWMKVYDKLPDLQEILAGKDIFSKDLDIMYATISGLVSIASSHDKKKSVFQRLINYAVAMPPDFVELGVWLSKDLTKMDYDAVKVCNLDKWVQRYGELVI